MKKKKYDLKLKRRKAVRYTEKKPFLADKEIIFRSAGRARVFNISHKLQVFALILMTAVFCWSGYNYHFYHTSAKIIHRKDKELGKTRDAYVDLMTDVAALQNNLKEVVSSMDNMDNDIDEVKNYKEQMQTVEDKIRQIADTETWIDSDKVEEKVTKKEALIQKDLALKENDALRERIGQLSLSLKNLQETVHGLEAAEMAILEKIGKLSGQEIDQIKSSLSQINNSLKGQKKYFNPLANIKSGEGGPYIPVPNVSLSEQLNDKLSETFKKIDLLDAYKSAISKLPLGSPIYNYRVSSYFGRRSDPFKTKLAYHKGLDMSAAVGTRISAMASGKVICAEYQKNGYGNIVEIKHADGFVTKYAHLNKIYVKKGQYITRNQAIGEVGRSGRATGSHLHYEILYGGANVNPLTFINIRDNNNS